MFYKVLFYGTLFSSCTFPSVSYSASKVNMFLAEELLHCSIMTGDLRWPGYLTMTFAMLAYKPCQDIKDIEERNKCSNPIRSRANRAKEEKLFSESDMDYCLNLISNDVDTVKLRNLLKEQKAQYYKKKNIESE
ncbi:hypothetical protein L3V23_06440 [Vibrio sp. A1-b2]|nr:hypothetical protein [Vibrio sp. A1-b2]MCF7361713.1 hypothetical protein [Vibrio sp. A1-b2]